MGREGGRVEPDLSQWRQAHREGLGWIPILRERFSSHRGLRPLTREWWWLQPSSGWGCWDVWQGQELDWVFPAQDIP